MAKQKDYKALREERKARWRHAQNVGFGPWEVRAWKEINRPDRVEK